MATQVIPTMPSPTSLPAVLTQTRARPSSPSSLRVRLPPWFRRGRVPAHRSKPPTTPTIQNVIKKHQLATLLENYNADCEEAFCCSTESSSYSVVGESSDANCEHAICCSSASSSSNSVARNSYDADCEEGFCCSSESSQSLGSRDSSDDCCSSVASNSVGRNRSDAGLCCSSASSHSLGSRHSSAESRTSSVGYLC